MLRRYGLLAAVAVALLLGGGSFALTSAPAARPARYESSARLEAPARAELPAPRPEIARPERRPAAIRAVEPALATPASAPAVPPPPPNPAPPLPDPAPLPARWNRVALVDIGRIEIPKIGVDQIVREGVEQMVIDAGPAHWPGTAEFGSWGNVVLAGHRSSHSEPFRRAAELVAGDEIVVSDATGRYTYRVTGAEVVAPTAMWIVDQHEGRTLTIFTCHPSGSSAQRFVIYGELISAPRPGR